MGIRAFIFSGYPHLDECQPFRHQGAAASEDLLAAARLRPRARRHAATPLGAGETADEHGTRRTDPRPVPVAHRLRDVAARRRCRHLAEAHVQAKIEACLEQGITTFDQADIYGGYDRRIRLRRGAEGMRRPARPRSRSSPSATSCALGQVSRPSAEALRHLGRAHHRLARGESLRNMHTESVDLLLIHRPDPLMDHYETGRALDDLVASGKVRAVGVSNFRPVGLDAAAIGDGTPLVTNQIEMSLPPTTPSPTAIWPSCRNAACRPMAWSPLGGGGSSSPRTTRCAARWPTSARRRASTPRPSPWPGCWRHPARILPVMGTNNLGPHPRPVGRHAGGDRPRDWFDLYTPRWATGCPDGRRSRHVRDRLHPRPGDAARVPRPRSAGSPPASRCHLRRAGRALWG